MNRQKVILGFIIAITGISSLLFTMRTNDSPEMTSSHISSSNNSTDLLLAKDNSTPKELATETVEQEMDKPISNNTSLQSIEIGPGIKGFSFEGNAHIERTPEQMEQLGKELELWEIMMSSEYASYSAATLISLAEQGDPIAFHQLIVSGEISVDNIQRLAKQLGQQGYPMIYGFAADGIFGSTNDKILAMAYYMAAVNHGSELMRQFELDYKIWFRLKEDEIALAAELADEL